MKVILLRDVAKLGRRNSVIEVPDGFALNKLIPQKMAVPATAENLKKVHARTDHVEHSVAEKTDKFKTMIKALEHQPVTLHADANAQDHLFKAVKAPEVVTALSAIGYTIDATMVEMEPIKSLGTHVVTLKSGAEKGNITLSINRK
jgi:large subunit ribosomal protein L9